MDTVFHVSSWSSSYEKTSLVCYFPPSRTLACHCNWWKRNIKAVVVGKNITTEWEYKNWTKVGDGDGDGDRYLVSKEFVAYRSQFSFRLLLNLRALLNSLTTKSMFTFTFTFLTDIENRNHSSDLTFPYAHYVKDKLFRSAEQTIALKWTDLSWIKMDPPQLTRFSTRTIQSTVWLSCVSKVKVR